MTPTPTSQLIASTDATDATRRLTLTTATGEPTDCFCDHARELPAVLAELGTAHLQAAAVAAELDLDDAELWEQADGIVVALSAEAYRWTEVLTGESATSAAVLAPPVVRLRELSVALRSTHWPGSIDENHASAPAIQGDG